MTDPERKPREPELSDEEVEKQKGRPLPDREAMSLITPGSDMPPRGTGADQRRTNG
jgi:hypothetical protein